MKKKRGKKVAIKKTGKKKGIKQIRERVPTGIPGFDKHIEGGFEKNAVNLIVGGSGSGKTIFSVQFLMNGLQKGEKVMYITFEEKKAEFYDNMRNFGWDLDDYEKKGRFFFLEYSPEKVESMLEEGGGAIESIVLKYGITRIVIDSITSFALLFEEELKRREAALSLFGIIRNWKCTSLLTLEDEKPEAKGGVASSIEFEADSIIVIYFVRRKIRRERFIEVLKMRGTHHSTEIYNFDIGSRGISIGSKKLVDLI
jgi:KaiC/GvpD/RAD55 family RecA-like ATPase